MKNHEVRRKFLSLTIVKDASAPERDHVLTFRGSAGSLDRDGDILVPDGCDTSNYMKNPVFLWAHDWHGRLPVGRALDVRKVSGQGVDFDILFDEGDPFAMDVERKYKGGFLNAVSVGMDPKTWVENRNEMGEVTGYTFTEWELLELSGVPIPANADALQLSYAKWLETNGGEPGMAKASEKPPESIKEPDAVEVPDPAADATEGTTDAPETKGEGDAPAPPDVVTAAAFEEWKTSVETRLDGIVTLLTAMLPQEKGADEAEGGDDSSDEEKALKAALSEEGVSEEDALALLTASVKRADPVDMEGFIEQSVQRELAYRAGKAWTTRKEQ